MVHATHLESCISIKLGYLASFGINHYLHFAVTVGVALGLVASDVIEVNVVVVREVQ